jgi:Xaa-Pro aminopeptidase
MSKPPLLYAASEANADLLYFGRFFAPDAFVAFGHGRKKYALLNALEIARGRRESAFDEVLSLEEWRDRAKKELTGEKIGIAEIVATVAREFGLKEFRVAGDFPLGLARRLEALGLSLELAEGGLFPERERKTEEEAKAIREGNACSAAGIRAAEKVLREATIKNGRIHYQGRSLTSERLKEEIEIACLRRGAVSANTIAAGGDQACDPHCRGSGVLKANELIIVDVFPRVNATGYHGDMTRTFLKGRASDEQKKLVAAVREAQREAIAAIKAGVSGDAVHRGVVEHFEGKGYKTDSRAAQPIGFFHGTGHGLGLEVHEAPRLSTQGPRLKEGQVVTVEPGLYYPSLGAVRIEDVVWVRKEGAELLSEYHYRWEIR